MICFLDIVTIGLLGNPFIFSPLPDYTHASYPFGISSVRPALFTKTLKRPDRQVANALVNSGIGCHVCFAFVSPPFHSGETLAYPTKHTQKTKKKKDGYLLSRNQASPISCFWRVT